MFYQTLNLENKRQIFCPQLQFLIVPIWSDTRITYIYFVIYIEIIVYLYTIPHSKGKELIEYSHKDHRSVSVGITRSVWPRTCWSKGNDKGRSARRKNTRLERPPAERATRIAFAVGYRPSRSLIAREFGFTARSFSATFISSVLRLLVRVARPSTPCTVHRRLMIPSEWEIDH